MATHPTPMVPAGFDLASECTGGWHRHGLDTCVHAMAAGWITNPDLCRPCTRTHRAALDAVVPVLAWHAKYREEPACCPGCGAQLPENAGCQTAACDGLAADR